jgi:hypothetical protein
MGIANERKHLTRKICSTGRVEKGEGVLELELG